MEEAIEKESAMTKLENFERTLREQEKSENTIQKYIRDIRCFLAFAGEREIEQELVRAYKKTLMETYRISSVNSMLIALNGYLRFIGKGDCCVRTCKQQRRIFLEEERELSRGEYQRLVFEAKRAGKQRLCHILQTIASTGIRIGELRYITVEALKTRRVQIDSKGKVRIIILPQSLVQMLKDYCRKRKICAGSIFITRSGQPVDRRNVWAEMKSICEKARVMKSKVFPHNLRHLFAKCFYERERDLVRLADYLGHSSVETTRRYTMISSMAACEKQLELGLLVGEGEPQKKKNDIMCIMSY